MYWCVCKFGDVGKVVVVDVCDDVILFGNDVVVEDGFFGDV